MGILIPSDHKLRTFAELTEEIEKNARSYVQEGMRESQRIIKSLKQLGLDEACSLLTRALKAEEGYYLFYKTIGLSDKFLEQACNGSTKGDVLLHPIEGSKDITDVFLREDIANEFRSLSQGLENLSENSRNKKINEYLGSLGDDVSRCNLKGMQAKKGRKQDKFTATITLSRSTKGQEEKNYDVNMACDELNYKLGSVLDYILVWFRRRDKEQFWRYKVVGFPPTAFFIKDSKKFIQKNNQKQYKYENHTEFTYLTINPGASYQFNCVCSDVENFIRESAAEVLYDSWTK
jgi:hypothetical protein